MAHSSLQPPVVIFACRVFQNWLEHLLPEGLRANVTFFDYALHRVPKNLRQTLQDALDNLEQPSLVMLGYGLCGNAEWLMDTQYHNYKRLALVVQNEQDLETYRPAALEVARYCERWGMRYEELVGTDDMLRRLIEIAVQLDQVDGDFVVVPPGGTLTQTMFFR